jgi:peptide/nickel transport system permease protein
LPNTLKLASLAIVLATLIGIVTGIISAVKQYTAADHTATGVALIGVSMPPFWLGLILILIFSVKFKCLPSAGITCGSMNNATLHWGRPSPGIINAMTPRA